MCIRDRVRAAYKAVMKPTEGTILTVSRLAAAAASEAAAEDNRAEFVLEKAIAAGEVALADTINQNPVLQKAGVVDAGGKDVYKRQGDPQGHQTGKQAGKQGGIVEDAHACLLYTS